MLALPAACKAILGDLGGLNRFQVHVRTEATRVQSYFLFARSTAQ